MVRGCCEAMILRAGICTKFIVFLIYVSIKLSPVTRAQTIEIAAQAVGVLRDARSASNKIGDNSLGIIKRPPGLKFCLFHA
jgi:hypothetical protein